MNFVEVTEYTENFPEGHVVKIPICNIEKFYRTEPDTTLYIVGGQVDIKEKTMIECRTERNEYTAYYFSDLDYEEFGKEAHLEPVADRFEILDL